MWFAEAKIKAGNLFCVFQALILVVILGWVFVPIYIKAGVKKKTETRSHYHNY